MFYGGVMTFAQRLGLVQAGLLAAGIDAALMTPGADLRYLTGYDAKALERLTCLVVRANADPVLVVPALEVLAAQASPVKELGLEICSWQETENPYALTAHLVGPASVVALDDHMWAQKVLDLRAEMPATRQVLAGQIIAPIRMRKDASEIAALRRAGAAIDEVHAKVPGCLRPGRTEREVGIDIANLIIAAGHVAVDFIIVASGPNAASPHHEVSDRVLEIGDPVVVDIGGTMPDGYRSDCTRTYHLGAPGAEYASSYAILLQAQMAACAAVQPKVTCEQVDATARAVLTAAGLGELFIHRTGHGIGLESHEEPYMVAGNALPLAAGMVFSVEPGFYLAGSYGARIEDIVVCTDSGYESLNHQPRDLVIV
jgi:Xaa-Pro aminopeptidase